MEDIKKKNQRINEGEKKSDEKETREKRNEELKKKNSERGKKSRAAGQRFEAKVRAGLEKMGWVVDRWTNTVDYNREDGIGKVVPAKRKYNPFKKVMVIGTGFPDFICIKNENNVQHVWGVEVKRNGYLDQVEKGMCYWLLTNKVFSKILIAKMKKNGNKTEVEYDDFMEKYGKKMEVKKG